MMDFTKEEIRLLLGNGYHPAFMMDVTEGNLVAIPPVSRNTINGEAALVKTLRVERLMNFRKQNYDFDNDRFVEHDVVIFIGIDLDGLPEHCSYGNTYGCFIKTEDEDND
jgi:hypothetical protein